MVCTAVIVHWIASAVNRLIAMFSVNFFWANFCDSNALFRAPHRSRVRRRRIDSLEAVLVGGLVGGCGLASYLSL